MDADKELATLRDLSPAAELWTEGGKAVAFLPSVKFTAAKKAVMRNLLLWPHERDGYSSRLFLSEAVAAPNANNWKSFNLFSKNWFACSWQGVPNTLPWVQILANHLRAFQ